MTKYPLLTFREIQRDFPWSSLPGRGLPPVSASSPAQQTEVCVPDAAGDWPKRTMLGDTPLLPAPPLRTASMEVRINVSRQQVEKVFGLEEFLVLQGGRGAPRAPPRVRRPISALPVSPGQRASGCHLGGGPKKSSGPALTAGGVLTDAAQPPPTFLGTGRSPWPGP